MSAHWSSFAVHAMSSLCLLIVALACVAHLNEMNRATPACERVGCVLTSAGAFGNAIYPWWPSIEYFPLDLILHSGMALIGLAMLRNPVRVWIAKIPEITKRRKATL